MTACGLEERIEKGAWSRSERDSVSDRWTWLYTCAVNIRLLASGASQCAVAIGADVKVSGVVLTRHRSADRALPAIRYPSALRAQ